MGKTPEVVLACTIIGLALAVGGVLPISYFLAEVVLFILVSLLLVMQSRSGRIGLPLPIAVVPFFLLVSLQLIPAPSRFIMTISPVRLSAYELGGPRQSYPDWTTISIYPHDTLVSLLKFLAYLSAFVLAAYFFDSRKGKSTLLQALIILGCFEAGYGIVQYVTGWHKIFTYTNVFDMYDATGTYINRNHFAGLLELILPFVLASIFYSFQRRADPSSADDLRRSSSGQSFLNFQALFYLFLVALMSVALVFSRSRGGILAMALMLTFVAMLGQVGARRKGWMLLVVLCFTVVVGYGLWIGLDPVLARFEEMGEENFLQLEGRTAIWKDTLQTVREYPLTGTGLGTFGVVFRRFQSHLVNNYVDHAHNDYLEFASETGLVGAAVLFLPILYLFAKMVFSFLDEPRRYRSSVLLGCIGATLAILIHSLTDFNLQIPANALIFAVVLGIGYKAACVEQRDRGVSVRRIQAVWGPH